MQELQRAAPSKQLLNIPLYRKYFWGMLCPSAFSSSSRISAHTCLCGLTLRTPKACSPPSSPASHTLNLRFLPPGATCPVDPHVCVSEQAFLSLAGPSGRLHLIPASLFDGQALGTFRVPRAVCGGGTGGGGGGGLVNRRTTALKRHGTWLLCGSLPRGPLPLPGEGSHSFLRIPATATAAHQLTTSPLTLVQSAPWIPAGSSARQLYQASPGSRS